MVDSSQQKGNGEDPDFEAAREMAAIVGPMNFTSLGEGAASMHEMYLTFREFFQPDQAVYLVAALLTGNPGKPPVTPDNEGK